MQWTEASFNAFYGSGAGSTNPATTQVTTNNGITVNWVVGGKWDYVAPATATAAAPSAPNISPITPHSDPTEVANATIGRRISLSSLGLARIGSQIVFGPYQNGDLVSFGVSFGNFVPVDGTRVIFDIALDGEIVWRCPAGGTAPGDGEFLVEPFTFRFYPGRLDQAIDPLETAKFSDDAQSYRPQAMLFFENLNTTRWKARTGKLTPYVSPLIGDTTDGANPFDGINLGTSLERIARSYWARYTTDTFGTEGITEVVGGTILGENFNIVEICRNVCRLWPNLDFLQRGRKLLLRDYGAVVAPDMVFTRDSIIASEQPLPFTRTAPSAQPRERELITLDAERDYTLAPAVSWRPRDPVKPSVAVGRDTITAPFIMDAGTRQALATYSQFSEENQRETASWTAGIDALGLEPGDRVGISISNSGLPNRVLRVEETNHTADHKVQIVGKAVMRCNLLGDPSQGTATFYSFNGGATDTFTFTDCDLGTEAADRTIVLGIHINKTISPVREVVSATIDGNTVPIRVGHAEGSASIGVEPNVALAIASVLFPAGATGDIVITTSGNVSACGVFVLPLYGLGSSVPVDTAFNGTDGGVPSVTIDKPAFGITVAIYSGTGGTPGPVTFSGLNTENYDTAVSPQHQAAGATEVGLAVAQANQTVSLSVAPASGREALVAASFA